MNKSLYIFFIFTLQFSFVADAQTKISCVWGDTLSIELTNARGTIQWQNSNDSLSWNNIAGQNSIVLDYFPSSGSQWVRAILNEDNCPEFIDEPVEIFALDTTLTGNDVDVVLLDTVLIQFQADSAQQANGIYQFSSQTNDPSLKPGDIIIGTNDEGFLRFVDSYVLQNGILTVNTHQATLDDLFEDANFSFDLSVDSLETRSSGFNVDFNQTELFNQGPVSLSLTSGSIGMTGDWNGGMVYSLLNGLQSFYFGSDNLNLNAQFNFNLNATVAADVFNGSKSLAKFNKPIRALVGGVPVIITLSAELIAKYSLNLSAEINMDANFTSNIAVNTSFDFSNGQWNNTFNVNPTNNIEFTNAERKKQATLNLALVPEFKMKIYGIVVPYINPSAHLGVTATSQADPNLNWDIFAEAYGKLEFGIEDIVILGNTIATFPPNNFESSHTEYKTPYSLELLSGNGQNGFTSTSLNNPIVLKIKDSFGFTQSNVPVQVTVNQGGGTVSQTDLLSDTNGLVSVNWTLGADSLQSQELRFSAKNGNNEELSGSTIIVTASFNSFGCGSTTSVTDIDGNVYPVVEIGTQCWTQENLRTTRFRDGTIIPNVTDDTEFDLLSTPAWCNFNNDANNGLIYGKLYNWFTVSDPHQVCPVGWHVPTTDEFTNLVIYLGGNPAGAGGKMKSTNLWQPPNTGATNESGFSGLPGGRRMTAGAFQILDYAGYWWTSSEMGGGGYRMLTYNLDTSSSSYTYKQYGFSVRCLKD